jgi:transcriptional regulator with XRE-family HTH domain
MRLSHRRLAIDIRSEDIATILGLQDADILEFEAGRRHIDPQTLHRLAQILHCSIKYFFDDESVMNRRTGAGGHSSAGRPVAMTNIVEFDNAVGKFTIMNLIESFENIPSDIVKATILNFISSLSEQDTLGVLGSGKVENAPSAGRPEDHLQDNPSRKQRNET